MHPPCMAHVIGAHQAINRIGFAQLFKSTQVDRPVTHPVAGWNCPQYIEPRFTAADIAPALTRLHNRIDDLEAELATK